MYDIHQKVCLRSNNNRTLCYHKRGQGKGVHGWFELDTCSLKLLPCWPFFIQFSLDLSCLLELTSLFNAPLTWVVLWRLSLFLRRLCDPYEVSMYPAHSWEKALITIVQGSLFCFSRVFFLFQLWSNPCETMAVISANGKRHHGLMAEKTLHKFGTCYWKYFRKWDGFEGITMAGMSSTAGADTVKSATLLLLLMDRFN